MTPDPGLLWKISVVLLAAVALSLLAPLFGAPMPPPWAIAALLALRFGVQLQRSKLLGERQNLLSLALMGVLLALLVLALRRLPVIVLLRPWLPALRDWPITLIMGWFGPIGVSTLYYATLISSRTGYDLAWTVGTLLVLASMVVHGMTAAPFAMRYGRWRQRYS